MLRLCKHYSTHRSTKYQKTKSVTVNIQKKGHLYLCRNVYLSRLNKYYLRLYYLICLFQRIIHTYIKILPNKGKISVLQYLNIHPIQTSNIWIFNEYSITWIIHFKFVRFWIYNVLIKYSNYCKIILDFSYYTQFIRNIVLDTLVIRKYIFILFRRKNIHFKYIYFTEHM